MEAEKEGEDPFSSMIKLCHPTSSQESTFSYCPLAREAEILVNPNSSSPDPTPSPPTPILMITLPDSGDAVPEVEEEESDAIFHTPPENHLRSSSSEEQNFVDFGDESTRVRVSQRGSEDDDSMSKKVRVSDLEEDTMPADDTEEILVEETASVHDTEVIDLDSEETVNLGDDVVMVDKIDQVAEIGGEGVDSVGENQEMEIDGKAVEDVELNEGKNHSENSHLDRSLDSSKIEEEFVTVSDKRIEMREESGVGGLEKVVVKVTEARENSDGGRRTNVKSIDKIDKFAYHGGGDVERRSKSITGRGGGRVSKLPVSMKGKEKKVGCGDVVEEAAKTKKKSGLLDLLDVLKVVVGDGDGDGGSEDVDFLETAKKRGLTFPRPRWWPPEGEDKNIFG